MFCGCVKWAKFVTKVFCVSDGRLHCYSMPRM